MGQTDTKRAHGPQSRLRILLVYYSVFSPFIKNDCDLLSRHYTVSQINIKTFKDIFSQVSAVSKCDLTFHLVRRKARFSSGPLVKDLPEKIGRICWRICCSLFAGDQLWTFTLGWQNRMYAKYALKHADKV